MIKVIIIIIMFCFSLWKCLYNPYQAKPKKLRYVKAVKSSLKFIVCSLLYIVYFILNIYMIKKQNFKKKRKK